MSDPVTEAVEYGVAVPITPADDRPLTIATVERCLRSCGMRAREVLSALPADYRGRLELRLTLVPEPKE